MTPLILVTEQPHGGSGAYTPIVKLTPQVSVSTLRWRDCYVFLLRVSALRLRRVCSSPGDFKWTSVSRAAQPDRHFCNLFPICVALAIKAKRNSNAIGKAPTRVVGVPCSHSTLKT